MKKFTDYLLPVFILLSLINVAGAAMDNASLQLYTKPLLVVCLMVYLFYAVKSLPGKLLVLTGLLFSWLGDVLLMQDQQQPLFFIAGLICFLITHLLYIVYLLRIRSIRPSLLRRYPWMGALVLAYGFQLVHFLYPRLGALRPAVILYAAVICCMVLASLHAYTKSNAPSNWLFLVGAILFVASDSILAVNKFYHPFASAGMLIMVTYCAAQLLIVMAVAKRKLLTVV